MGGEPAANNVEEQQETSVAKFEARAPVEELDVTVPEGQQIPNDMVKVSLLSGAIVSLGKAVPTNVAELKLVVARSLSKPPSFVRIVHGKQVLRGGMSLGKLPGQEVQAILLTCADDALKANVEELAHKPRELRSDLSKSVREGKILLGDPYTRRIEKEFRDANQVGAGLHFAVTAGKNIRHVQAVVIGPKDTPYEDRLFVLHFIYSAKHPLEPPVVCFDTKIFHANVSPEGLWCTNLFAGASWSPTLTLKAILHHVVLTLSVENHSTIHAANKEAVALLATDRLAYESTARQWADEYAE